MIPKKEILRRSQLFSSPLAVHHYIALHLSTSPELLSIGWSSIGLPLDRTFIQEDDIESIDSMGTLDIKSHLYSDTWVSIIFVQQNIFICIHIYTYFVPKTALKKIHVAGTNQFSKCFHSSWNNLC